MRVRHLRIKNYRSIQELEIELGGLNAFIGPNNAGKSNILQALNLVLGESYPTLRSFDLRDFYRGNTNQPIEIWVCFDEPIDPSAEGIWGFKLSFDKENNLNFVATDRDGNEKQYSSGREIKVTNQMRDKIPLMYLSLDRLARQQIRPSQWTIFGKILKHLENQIDESNREQFRTAVASAFDSNLYPTVKRVEDKLRNYINEQTGLDITLKLHTLDPLRVLQNLRPYLKEPGLEHEFDAEDMGAGTQSALAIALARVYAEEVREALVLVIEEPELYLHPHACRHFYSILKDLSQKGVQVIYATHERSFVNIADYNCIYLVRKESNATKIVSAKDFNVTNKERLKMISKFNEGLHEVFFASQVVLVEGPDDQIACKCALDKLGLDLDKLGISVIDCGGKEELVQIASILQRFNIPIYALVDKDPGNPVSAKQSQELIKLLGNDSVLFQNPNLEGIFGLSKKLSKKEAIEFFPNWFQNNEPADIYKDLLVKLKGI